MKKLILFLMIFTMLLTGCSAPALVEGENETPDVPPTEEQTPTPDDDTPKLPASTIIYPEPQPERKPPAVPITNKNDPQDENADFLFVFDVKYGEFARGERMELEVELINNTGATHTYEGATAYRAPVKLFCLVNGEEYVLEHEMVPDTADSGMYYDIEAGKSRSWIYYYNIPADAPAGEYTLVCRYQTTRTEFKGYFTME